MNVLFLVNVIRFYSGSKLRSTKNTVRKNLFLSVCHCLDENISLHVMDKDFPFGGLIGYGDSHLDKLFRFSKVLRLHEILHDAAGAGYLHNGEGLGYSCLLVHVTGLLYCLYWKLIAPSIFNLVDF